VELAPLLYDLAYLVAAVLFIFGLKFLSSPRTAPLGNSLGAFGMFLAVIVTLLKMNAETGIIGWPVILAGVALGGLIGGVMAKRVEMTGMPELVGLFNGFGGGASALVALSEGLRARGAFVDPDPANIGDIVFPIAVGTSSLIGWVTLTGSLIAVFKLNGVFRKNVFLPGQNGIKALLFLGCLAMIGGLVSTPGSVALMVGLAVAACVLGVLFVIPIGGADMPVVVSFLNSLSGLAAAATGFVVSNNALIIGGSLVGAAGLILTGIMCKAMNRRFLDVVFKAYGGGAAEASGEKRTVQGYEAEEAALVFDGARSVIIVPGYGMAVSQAQHVVQEFATVLEERGVDVKFAIHPVAGRMPGHMNVLLAEASVPYDKLFDLDEINSEFSDCDVALVVGANDTVNPAAKTDPGGPLGGMPILDVEKARTVLIVKRSLSPGYAGVDNDLFYRPSTMMLFGDGKKMLTELLSAVKEL